MTPVGRFTIGPEHPSLAGHFPGRPVVPGVVLLDHAIAAILDGRACGLRGVKFLRPVLPGETVSVACLAASAGEMAFECSVAGALVARGSLALRT